MSTQPIHARATALAVTLSLMPLPALAQTVIEHQGATDPDTQGWTQAASGVPEGPILDDQGSGIDAWIIDDSSSTAGAFYTFAPSPDDVDAAAAQGWVLSVRLRVVDVADLPDRSIFAEYMDASSAVRWRMDFGSNAMGTPLVLLQTGTLGNVDTGTLIDPEIDSGYHTYELRYDAGCQATSFFVDDALVLGDFAGFSGPGATPETRVAFGAGSSADLGHAHYAEVSFAVVASEDSDCDTVADSMDNCSIVPNPQQRDTDGDGIGNACDADLSNDCVISFVDLGLIKAVFFTADPNADFNGDGLVNAADLGIMKAAFFQAPGPSGVPNACDDFPQ